MCYACQHPEHEGLPHGWEPISNPPTGKVTLLLEDDTEVEGKLFNGKIVDQMGNEITDIKGWKPR